MAMDLRGADRRLQLSPRGGTHSFADQDTQEAWKLHQNLWKACRLDDRRRESRKISAPQSETIAFLAIAAWARHIGDTTRYIFCRPKHRGKPCCWRRRRLDDMKRTLRPPVLKDPRVDRGWVPLGTASLALSAYHQRLHRKHRIRHPCTQCLRKRTWF